MELRLQQIKRTEERDMEIKDDIEEELDEGIGRICEPGDLLGKYLSNYHK